MNLDISEIVPKTGPLPKHNPALYSIDLGHLAIYCNLLQNFVALLRSVGGQVKILNRIVI